MDFYPLKFCSIITCTELQQATYANNERVDLLILHPSVAAPVGLALRTPESFPFRGSACLGLISLCFFFVRNLKYLLHFRI